MLKAPREFYVPAVFGDDAPSPRVVVSRILGAATLLVVAALLLVLVSTGQFEWRLVTLAGILWAAWSFIGGLLGQVVEPAGRFLANHLTGNVSLPQQDYTIDEQTARLERLLTQGLKPHHAVLIGIRLAEIYRTHQKDPAKSDILLAQLRAKYPDAPELEHGDPG
ncbi:MAG: hypothetical protein ACREMF_03835 [Gemmatimonadales bacterium]